MHAKVRWEHEQQRSTAAAARCVAAARAALDWTLHSAYSSAFSKAGFFVFLSFKAQLAHFFKFQKGRAAAAAQRCP